MRSIVTLITAAAFLLHFALGCCAHHAHAAEGTTCQHEAVGAAKQCHHHRHGHSHKHESSEEQTPDESEHSDEKCAEGHCVFMAAAKTSVAKITFAALLPLLLDAACLGPSAQFTDGAVDPGGFIALPVRIHLLNQVLLI